MAIEKHSVCVIWIDVPETHYIVYMDVDAKTLEKLKTFDNNFINTGHNPEVEQEIADMFFKGPEGEFAFERQQQGAPFRPVEAVIVTGIVL